MDSNICSIINSFRFCLIPVTNRQSATVITSESTVTGNILKAQWQIWDTLQGASSLGVKFTRKILAWYDN